MKKIVFAEVEEWEQEPIQKNLPKNFNARLLHESINELTRKELEKTRILSIFIYSKIDRAMLEKMPLLEAIATRSTGTDHIDLEECRKRGIKVYNVPTYGENTVAEHTFGLILALSRKIYQAINRAKKGDFSVAGLQGFDLKGKTIGIIGMGNIGKHVARIAKGFGMAIIAFDIEKNQKLAKKLGFKYAGFDFLLQNSDIVTLHVPYNKNTHHLINRQNIGRIKKGAIIVNTARGGLIETNALIKALESHRIS
ncbi:MAG TPA: NAD(P)-dependent oxidoreductase, partial [archaeon]|nr:NAD(P)-dependent oxidoreductase [archaeon]